MYQRASTLAEKAKECVWVPNTHVKDGHGYMGL